MFESLKLFFEVKEREDKAESKGYYLLFVITVHVLFGFYHRFQKYTTDLSFPVKYTGYSVKKFNLKPSASTDVYLKWL